MKVLKRFLCIFVLWAVSFSTCAQVTNGGFENWSGDCELDGWAINSICGFVMPVTRTTTAQAGQFAVRGEVVSLFGQQALQPILQTGDEGNGFPIAERYGSLIGFYQFAPLSGDRMSVNVLFYKGDIENGEFVAHGAKVLPAAAAYTAFSVDLTYVTNTVPDRAYIQIMIIGPVTGSDYHVGSVMFVDSLTFGAGTGGGEPRLTISRAGNNVVVNWTADPGFKLQRSINLSSGQWDDVLGLQPTDRTYSFTPTTSVWFRLFKP